MKKLLILLIVFTISNQPVFADNYNLGEIVSGTFEPGKRLKIKLSAGNWQVVYKSSDIIVSGIYARAVGIAKVEKNEIIEIIEVEYIHTGGRYQGIVNGAVVEILYKDEYSGCYERADNYLFELYQRGSTHNCFKVGHFDLVKRLTNPADPELRGEAVQYKQWIKNSSVEVPKIVLSSNHYYFSQLVGSNFYSYAHIINPKYLNAPKSNFHTVDSSEYHKFNIEKYPEYKKIMNQWIYISAKNHKEFEKNVKAKPRHLLKLDKYISNEKEESSDTLIVDQIKKLNDLYKTGAITKEEFKKAKEKILKN